MKLIKLISFAAFVFLNANCIERAEAKTVLFHEQDADLTLQEIAESVLSQTLDSQIKTENKIYLKGEWPTEIKSTLIPSLVGVGRLIGSDQEATAFTTGAVINTISQIYLDHPEFQKTTLFTKIPDAVSMGISTFTRYQSDNSFNFYPPHDQEGVTVRRPIDMTLFPLWYGFTNIPNDADSTSVNYAAVLMNAILHNETLNIPDQTFKKFETFRDIKRNPMYYNRSENRKKTGAFMTWLYDEKNENMPRFFFASSKLGERIPFNKNDVDCVVNANIFKLKALAKKAELEGYAESCEMINDMIQKNEMATCGIYYPNTMNLAFSMATAEKAGDRCLIEDSKNKLIEIILKSQDTDGSWLNKDNFRSDRILTTAYAMYALLHFADVKDPVVNKALNHGLQYLLSVMKIKNGRVSWDKNNFFTATAIARSLVMWRSKAYTYSILSSVIFSMNQIKSEATAKDILRDYVYPVKKDDNVLQ